MIDDADRHPNITYAEMVAACQNDPKSTAVLMACLLFELDLLATKLPADGVAARAVRDAAGVTK